MKKTNSVRLFANILLLWLITCPGVNSLSRQCAINGKIYRHGESRVELRRGELYTCTCFYVPPITNLSCNKTGERAQMLVADSGGIQKFLLGKGRGFKQNYISGLQGIPVSVGVDSKMNYVFWSDVSNKGRGIFRAGLTDIGRITNLVSQDIFEPNGLAVDWLSKNIYWTDAQLGAIYVSNYNGENVARLIGGLSEPRGIDLLPFEGMMFWSDQSKGTIERAAMDGSEPRTIVQHLVWPNEVVADRVQRRIYWVDGYKHTIESCDFDGSKHTVVIDYSVTVESPAFGLSLFDGRLYFGVWGTNSIYSVTSIGQDLRRSANDIGDKPMGIAIVNQKLQERSGSDANLCWSDQRYCSHLCLPSSSTTYRCACPSNTGLVIASDGRTCVPPEEFLLYTSIDDGTVMLVSMMEQASRLPTMLAQSHQPSAVEFDPVEKMVYWSDVAMNRIYRKAMNESPIEIFLEDGIGTVDGLCVDWLNRHLYFTNIGTSRGGAPFHRIEMVDLRDPLTRKILTSSGFSKPRDLVVNMQRGDLYVSDWGTQPKVVRLDLDGQNPVELDVEVENPNGLAYHNQYLYITDSRRKSSIVQSNGTIIYRDTPKMLRYDVIMGYAEEVEMTNVEMQLPFGLAASSSKLYLTDWELGGIYEHDETTQSTTEFIVGVSRPTGIAYATTTIPLNLASACTGSNNCSDICVSSDEEDYLCLCSDESGTVPSENNQWNCVPPESFILVADGNRIMMKSLIPPDNRESYAVVQTFDMLSDIVAVTFDPITNYIYWADNGRQRINRKQLNGMGPDSIETVYRNIGQVDGMAIDPAHRLLYWTDVTKGTIEVMHLVSNLHATVLNQLDKPRAIVLSPEEGLMYWTEWGESPMLACAKMSGQEMQPVVTDDLQWPNGVLYDKESEKVFFTDGGTITIQATNVGERATGMVDEYIGLAGSAQHLYGLGKLEKSDSLIFSDWRNRTVMRMSNFRDAYDMRFDVVMEDMVKPSQIHVQNIFEYPAQIGPCQPRVHRCSHICIPDNGESVCLCPDHLLLADDGRTCVSEEQLNLMTTTLPTTTTATSPSTESSTAPWAVKITTTPATQVPSETATTYAALMENTTVVLNTTLRPVREVSTSTTATTPVPSTTTVTSTVVVAAAVARPKFDNCVQNTHFRLFLPPDNNYTLVSPELFNLTAKDGLGQPINVTAVNNQEEPVEAVRKGYGKHIVHFHAYDGIGQFAVCVVTVLVGDTTSPRSVSCPDNIRVDTYSGRPVYVSWETPRFEDNSGLPLMVNSSHDPGTFVSGWQDIEYKATDMAGNGAYCRFTIVVNKTTTDCGFPHIPENSQLSCTTDDDYVQKCLVTCDKGYRLALADPYIKCTHNRLSGKVQWLPFLDNNACRKPSVANVVQNLSAVFPCPCKPTPDFYDSRRKTFNSVLRTHKGCRIKRERLGFCNSAKDKISLECVEDIKLRVKMTVDMDAYQNMKSTDEVRRVVKRAVVELSDMVHQRKIVAKGTDSQDYPADNSTAVSEALVVCKEGTLWDANGCVPCPIGTFWKQDSCPFCPTDYFQDQPGRTFCHKCASNKETATYGSTNVQYCKLKVGDEAASVRNVIIGGVVGGVVLLLAILLVIGFAHRRVKNNKLKKEQEHKRRQRLAKERRRQKKREERNRSASQETNGTEGQAAAKTDNETAQPPNDHAASNGSAAVEAGAAAKAKTKHKKAAATPSEVSSTVGDDATSRGGSDIVTQTDVTSSKSVDDDAKSAGAESAIFTDGGASDTVSVISSEMPLKSALKKRPKPPPSYLEDDQTTVISASTISVGRVRQMQQRPLSLDEDRRNQYNTDSMRRGRARRSMSMRRPESASPTRFRPEGPQSLPVQAMPMKRSMSMERGPNPGYDPRLVPHMNPGAMMVRPMPPGGGPNMMGQPPRRRTPRYPTYGPRGMAPPPNMAYQQGNVRNPYLTLQPGSRPTRGGYWNPAFDGPPNWDNIPMRNEGNMGAPPQMRTMPRPMGPRYHSQNGMPPGGGVHGNIPPYLRHRMPSPPPYYA